MHSFVTTYKQKCTVASFNLAHPVYYLKLFIAMLLENEDKQKSGWKTSRRILNYGIYNLVQFTWKM